MNARVLFSLVVLLPVAGQETTWQERMESARMLVRAGKTADAVAIAEEVRAKALEGKRATLDSRHNEAAYAATRMLTHFARTTGDWARVEELLNETMDVLPLRSTQTDAANLLSEMAQARRAQGKLEEAVASLERAVFMRGALPESPEAARDFTTIGLLQIELKKIDDAKSWLLGAVQMWSRLMREDPEALAAMEALGALYRDEALYEDAEPLYERALRIRETFFGAKSAEVIGGLDNLAYCYFGSKKYERAEPLYKRLLEVWQATAAEDHPMIALTMEKMVTFYAAQQRWDDAQPLAERATQIRGKGLADAFRMRAMLAAHRNDSAASVEFITKATQVSDMAGVPKPPLKLLPAPKNAKPLSRTKSVPNTK